MPLPIQTTAAGLDLSPRVYQTKTVAASPTDATETVIASLTITQDVALNSGVILLGWGAFTQGTNGTGVTFKIRRTNASGTTVATTGILPYAAAVLGSVSAMGFDTSVTPLNQVYVLTALHTAATAASTYSAVQLIAIPV